MTSSIVPLQAVPSQTIRATLGNQAAQLNIYQKQLYDAATMTPALYMDVLLSGVVILGGSICLTGVKIIRDPYLGFNGDLMFFDTQGSLDPQWAGLNTRWFLAYLAP